MLVTQSGKKEIGSTVGMRRTANTSELYRYRIEKTVPEHVEKYVFEKIA